MTRDEAVSGGLLAVGVGVLVLPTLVSTAAGKGFASAIATGAGDPERWAAVLRINEYPWQLWAGLLLLGLATLAWYVETR